MSMIDKHGLEYRSSPQRSQGSHRLTNSNPHVPPIPTTPDFFELFGIEGAYPDSEFPFDDYKPTTADITVSASNNTANVGLSTVNDDLLALGFSSHLAVPQFDIIPGLPLTAPHEAQLEYYLQQSPPVKQVARGSGSKDSESVLKYYYQHFKNTQPLLRRIDQQFKKEVGSFKTVQASLNKRKEDGHWTCPIGCTNFTRKQNLKRTLLFLLTHFASIWSFNRSPPISSWDKGIWLQLRFVIQRAFWFETTPKKVSYFQLVHVGFKLSGMKTRFSYLELVSKNPLVLPDRCIECMRFCIDPFYLHSVYRIFFHYGLICSLLRYCCRNALNPWKQTAFLLACYWLCRSLVYIIWQSPIPVYLTRDFM